MIGDNIETDITFSKNGGIDSLCVLTGVSNEEMVQNTGIATYYTEYLM
jgi:ribonucleotide monophosphatase NagD (HAD superfamily)